MFPPTSFLRPHQHPFLKLAKPLASLHPLIIAAKEAARGHWARPNCTCFNRYQRLPVPSAPRRYRAVMTPTSAAPILTYLCINRPFRRYGSKRLFFFTWYINYLKYNVADLYFFTRAPCSPSGQLASLFRNIYGTAVFSDFISVTSVTQLNIFGNGRFPFGKIMIFWTAAKRYPVTVSSRSPDLHVDFLSKKLLFFFSCSRWLIFFLNRVYPLVLQWHGLKISELGNPRHISMDFTLMKILHRRVHSIPGKSFNFEYDFPGLDFLKFISQIFYFLK